MKARRLATAKLSGDEPWSGYDEQSVDAIRQALGDIDTQQATTVRSYERDHKDRSGVIEAAQQRIDDN